MRVATSPVCLCGKTEFEVAFTYHEPPTGEVRFDFNSNGNYSRRILHCRICGHFLSLHDMEMNNLYEGSYVSSTYGSDGIRRAFERIIGLDPAKSDNAGRVKRIVEFAAVHFSNGRKTPLSVLDVGSGLCVFLHRLKSETGWECTGLDPDPRAVAHARERVGVTAVCGDFMRLDELGRYDIVTFNKVLEHVVNPVVMLARSRRNLNPGGFVYIELPDGEGASAEGKEREEFFIDHHHIFSVRSTEELAARAGFRVSAIERLREPSTKYTIWAFLTPLV